MQHDEPKPNHPQAPEHFADEMMLEWCRVCEELDACGLLEKADRAILTLYCETWSVWRDAARHVGTHRAVVKFGNGVAGRSPFYSVMKETSAQLLALLNTLGLTPAARAKSKAPVSEPAPLDY